VISSIASAHGLTTSPFKSAYLGGETRRRCQPWQGDGTGAAKDITCNAILLGYV
jgi:hypothetical protein